MLHSNGKKHIFSDGLLLLLFCTYFGCCVGRFKRYRKHWACDIPSYLGKPRQSHSTILVTSAIKIQQRSRRKVALERFNKKANKKSGAWEDIKFPEATIEFDGYKKESVGIQKIILLYGG